MNILDFTNTLTLYLVAFEIPNVYTNNAVDTTLIMQVPISLNNEDSIIETLENSFGELDNKGDLASSIISASYNLVDDNVQDYLTDINDVKENSFLEELDDYNVEFNFRNLLSNPNS